LRSSPEVRFNAQTSSLRRFLRLAHEGRFCFDEGKARPAFTTSIELELDRLGAKASLDAQRGRLH